MSKVEKLKELVDNYDELQEIGEEEEAADVLAELLETIREGSY